MTIRQTIAGIIAAHDADPFNVNAGDAARLICGYLACECGLDNGNGWYDDDVEMSEQDDKEGKSGLYRAMETWLARSSQAAD